MNWVRENLRPSETASACASVVLPTPGNVLDQQVAAGEQAGDAVFDLRALADDDRANLVDEFGQLARQEVGSSTRHY